MDYYREAWYQFLDEGMADLVNLSLSLLKTFSIQNSAFGISQIHDFSFVVFPMAKAYEGFLKKWFFTNGLIDQETYNSDHFRIGKSLNPSLGPKYKDNYYVYDKIVTQCHDPHLGDRLWQAWKQGRNLPFHYFPYHQHFLTIKEARDLVEKLALAMADAMNCRIS